jgi:hypothetical protein
VHPAEPELVRNPLPDRPAEVVQSEILNTRTPANDIDRAGVLASVAGLATGFTRARRSGEDKADVSGPKLAEQ